MSNLLSVASDIIQFLVAAGLMYALWEMDKRISLHVKYFTAEIDHVSEMVTRAKAELQAAHDEIERAHTRIDPKDADWHLEEDEMAP